VIPRLLLATQNRGKVSEIIPLLDGIVASVMCLADLTTRYGVEETASTFEGNAVLKAETLFTATGIMTLADDSGLEVDALDGMPGVRSARFAGADAADEENNAKLLGMLRPVADMSRRTARFRCAMALAMPGGTRTFEGAVEGIIAVHPAGTHGFGYDPLFIPAGYTQTFAELGPGIKLKLSHRTRALEKVVAFLKSK